LFSGNRTSTKSLNVGVVELGKEREGFTLINTYGGGRPDEL
jgi:hypothetical protein